MTTVEVGAEIVGHAHGAAHLGRGHVAADVDVAQLRDAQAFEGRRQAAHRQVHAVNLVMQALEGEAVGSGGEWDGAGDGRDGLDEPAPREIEGRSRGCATALRRISVGAVIRRRRNRAARRRGARKSQSIAATSCTAR